MCEDLSSFELDQIDRVESKYHEISKKNSEKLFEEKFKEVALAITQLYTSVGKFYTYKRPISWFFGENQHFPNIYLVMKVLILTEKSRFHHSISLRPKLMIFGRFWEETILNVSDKIDLFDRTFLMINCKTEKGNHRGPEAYSAFNYAACKLTEFYNEIKGLIHI